MGALPNIIMLIRLSYAHPVGLRNLHCIYERLLAVSETNILNAELPAEAHQVIQLIRDNENFLIVGHIRPDGDCFGSCLGLYGVLKSLGKSARFYTAGPVADFFGYLPHFD